MRGKGKWSERGLMWKGKGKLSFEMESEVRSRGCK